MYFQLLVGVLCLSSFCHASLCVISSFAIILKRKRELVALFFFIIRVSCYYKCSVTLPHGADGLCAVCDCSISLSSFLPSEWSNNP